MFFGFLCLSCKDSEKLVHFGSFYKIPLFILFCGLQGCQYFGVGIIYQSLLTTNYRKPIIDGKIRDDRYT